MTNAIRVIRPYRWYGTWVFDDPEVDLVREPFVAGADTILDRMTEAFPNADDGFLLFFSDRAFPSATRAEWLREEMDGNVYRVSELGLEGWLCPALLAYYETAPREVWFKATPETSGAAQCA